MKSSSIRSRGSRIQKRRSFLCEGQSPATPRFQRRLQLESLEERQLLAVDFFAAPPVVPLTNHVDVALGNLNGFEEPNLTINNRQDTGNILITSHNNSVASTDAFVNNSQGAFPVANFGDTWADFDTQGRAWWTNLDGGTGGVRVVEVNPITAAPIGTGVVVDIPPAGQSDDRQALAVDSFPNSPWHDNIYVVWTRFGTPGDGTRVMVARSADHGVTWTTNDIGTNVGFDQQVHIAVNGNGDVYAAYHLQVGFTGSNPDGTSGQIIVFRSTDGGTTWTQTATNPFNAGEADISFNRQETLASTFPGTDFLTQGSVQPYVLPDPVRSGNVYVIAADDTDNDHTTGDNSDLYIARSDNNGATWTRTLLPHGGGTNFQLFPTAVIDQFGNIVVSWYDNRRGLVNDGPDNIAGNGDDNFLLDWMGMYSVDGGIGWSAPFRINDTPFDPDETPITFFGNPPGPTTRIGEYYGLDLFGGTAYTVFNGNTPGDGTTSQQPIFDAFAIAGKLVVNGDDSGPTSDQFVIRRMAADPNYIEVLVNGQRQYVGLLESLTGITVNGLAGDDTLTVDSSNGLISLTEGIDFDGGTGFDRLNLTQTDGPTRTSSRINVGANPGDGQSVIDTQVVSFQNVEPVTDNVPATTFTLSSVPGIASLLDASNAINYTDAQLLTTAGRITVDNFEPVEFDNKTNLVIDARAGSDTINLNNPSTPTGLTSITVNGGDPTADADTVIVNGTTSANAIVIDQLTTAGARVVGAQPVTVNVAEAELLTIDGTGGVDNLTFVTPAGVQVISLEDNGPDADGGTVRMRNSAGDRSALLQVTFLGLGTDGISTGLSFADVSDTRVDELTITPRVQGNGSDQFDVSLTGTILLTENSTGFPNQQLPHIATPGVSRLNLSGLAGDDLFSIPGGHPFGGGVFIDGGNPSASDVLNFSGTGGAVTIDLQAGTVHEAGFGAVLLTGVETLNVSAGAGAILVNGRATAETVSVTPTGASTATLTASGLNLTINTSNTSLLTVDLLAGSDNLAVYGTQNGESITVTGTQVTVDALKTVNYSNTENLQVFGQAGDDAFDVTPSATTTIFIDGGDPIGTIPGDHLHVNNVIGVVFAGPEIDEGGYITTGQTVSFDHIESLSVTPDANCPFLIVGTNGDDDITIIARDASTHALADGIQDFTVSVNGGLEVLVLNKADLYIDAKSGDDDIVIRAPAPNDADWDVNVRVAGGPPSIGEPNEADRLVLETPGEDSIVFNPTGADTGNIVVDEDGDFAYTAGSTDSIITFGSFVFVCDDPAGDPIEFTYTSSPGGVELVEYDGEQTDAGATIDDITINGTAGDDATSVFLGGGPGGVNTGSFVSTGSPLFNFRSFVDLTANAGSGGFDRVAITATEGADTVTSDNDTVILAGMTVTLSAAIDRLDLNTLGGNDNIDLDLAEADPSFVREKVIDAGAGNDFVDLSGALDATIYGGTGDDVLIGTPDPDLIFGGAGNDVIIGGGGVDHEYGEEGNDRFGDPAAGDPAANDAGNDFMFGGDGVDTFVWDPGDGSDNINGGDDGADILIFNGTAGADLIELRAAGTNATHNNVVLGGATVDTHGVEQINVNGLAGGDTFIVSDLTTTEVGEVNVDVGAAGDADAVNVFGRTVSNNVAITAANVPVRVNVAGLKYDVDILGVALADSDTLTFFGLGGNDSIIVGGLSGFFSPDEVTINGGGGDDFISGFGTLNGEAGNDTLIGDGSAQTIGGGSGNDTLRGGSGIDALNGGSGEDTILLDFDGAVDTIDGGPDFDTILFAGTSGNDILSATQTPGGLLTHLNGANENDTLATAAGVRTVERVRIEAGSGDDAIFVLHADGLGVDAIVNTVLFDIDGGEAQTRDRLSVQDDNLNDLLLYRKAESDSAGSISVGPGNPESLENVFTNVEFIQPITGPGGQLLVFKHDPNENNDERINATHLGAGETINLDPTIDPGPLTVVPPGFLPLPGDQDFYRIVAEKTGTLDLQVYFDELPTVPSGRPGLPGAGNLDIEVYDVDGTLIAGAGPAFGGNDGGGTNPELNVDGDAFAENERIRIPAVQGQVYYLRVVAGDAAGLAINNYSVTIINDAGPTPYGLELDDSPANPSFVCPQVGAAPNSDTGRSQFDNITCDNTPTIVLRLDDAFFLQDLPGNSTPDTPPDEVIPIPFRAGPAQPVLPGYAIAIFDEGPNPNPAGTAPQVPLGFASQTSPGVYQFTSPALVDGSHFLSARVQLIDPATPQQTGFTARSALLEIIVDTVPPNVSFGEPGIPDDGVISDSDTGVAPPNPDTLIDLVTRDTTPTFWGRAEADTIIRVYADVDGDGILLIGTDVFLGQDTAIPLDGTNQEPDGFWKIESVVSLIDPDFFPIGGERTIFVTAEDVAGNTNGAGGSAGDVIVIFIDVQGPQITDVEINEQGNPYDLFDPKPSNDGPTPLVESIVLSIQDLPARTADFLIAAIKADIAENPGHYLLTGDYNGIIPIQDVIVTLIDPVAGEPALATIELVFWEFGDDGLPFTLDDQGGPLPDDRYTLFVNDEGIIDRAGNILDGESNADEPHDQDQLDPEILGVDGFPSGDGLPGGDFLARFTIDSVAEVGTYGAGSAWVDTNGNTSFDPTNGDFTNRDITYILGLTSDDLFAGNFAASVDNPETVDDETIADGFDKLAAYGRFNGVWRWLVDTDNDGVPNVNQPDPAGINGLPVAGNFDGNALNGDEVGVFTGTTWWFDTNHDFQVDTSLAVGANFVGYPFVGDFDGDGNDDLGAWTDDRFKFDLSSDGLDGAVDAQFRFGFPGANERPVAADVNGDGFDDVGLFVPNQASASPDEAAEWYILVSGQVQNNGDLQPGDVGPLPTLGPSIIDRIVIDPIDGQRIVRFTTKPFGRDIYLHYGDEFSLPIIGNFDPPVSAGADNLPSGGYNTRDAQDVNNDGIVSAIDALLVINHLNRHGSTPVTQGVFARAPFLDVNNNGQISATDALTVINELNTSASQATSGAEGEADEFFSALGASSSSSDDDLLVALANDLENQRRKK